MQWRFRFPVKEPKKNVIDEEMKPHTSSVCSKSEGASNLLANLGKHSVWTVIGLHYYIPLIYFSVLLYLEQPHKLMSLTKLRSMVGVSAFLAMI